MTPGLLLELGIRPALALLPDAMDTPQARAMILAICLQESDCQHRRQHGGPARGYAQFEPGDRAAIAGVLRHPQTARYALQVCTALDILPTADTVYAAVEFNDVLMACFARLLLWTLPSALPGEGEVDLAWNQYLEAWRPGRPRPDDWPNNFLQAWHVVTSDAPEP